MKKRRTLIKLMVSLGAIILMLSLCGCPSPIYFLLDTAGYYPGTEKFPNTRWKCQEVDMYFDMFDCGELYMIGEYTVDDKTYRAVVYFFMGGVDVDLCASTDMLESTFLNEDGVAYKKCERNVIAELDASYLYKNGVIVFERLTVLSDFDIWHYEGDTLTFEKVDAIAEEPSVRWRCEEIDMYIDSFSDTPGYYKGEITMDGEKVVVQGVELGNGNYYMFRLNEKYNDVQGWNSDYLVCAFFEYTGGKIIAYITDEVCDSPLVYDNWTYSGTTLTFVQEAVH